MLESFSLYIHIPFCTRKCDYCHFFVLPDNEKPKDQLLEGLTMEWDRWSSILKGKKLSSIYFGGGTPFLFGPKRVKEFLKLIPSITSETEITLEANPENINYEQMKAYADLGINRVSIGLQSLDDQLLKLLTRTHNAQSAIDAVYTTAKAGISNISVDLMFDIPGQTLDHWKVSLNQVVKLPIKHLSLYNLTFEPHTTFFKNKTQLQKMLPEEYVSTEMYKMAEETLEGASFERYEISAYAKKGFHSRHNTGYWTARPFLGLGPSAFSYWDKKRFRNVANLNKYLEALKEQKSPADFEEELDIEAQRRELLTIKLRMKEGCDLAQFEQQFGALDSETKKNIGKLTEEGFLVKNGAVILLSQKGVLFYDTVATILI